MKLFILFAVYFVFTSAVACDVNNTNLCSGTGGYCVNDTCQPISCTNDTDCPQQPYLPEDCWYSQCLTGNCTPIKCGPGGNPGIPCIGQPGVCTPAAPSLPPPTPPPTPEPTRPQDCVTTANCTVGNENHTLFCLDGGICGTIDCANSPAICGDFPVVCAITFCADDNMCHFFPCSENDCVNGTCVLPTATPTTAPTSAPTSAPTPAPQQCETTADCTLDNEDHTLFCLEGGTCGSISCSDTASVCSDFPVRCAVTLCASDDLCHFFPCTENDCVNDICVPSPPPTTTTNTVAIVSFVFFGVIILVCFCLCCVAVACEKRRRKCAYATV